MYTIHSTTWTSPPCSLKRFASASVGEDPFSKAKHKQHHVLLRDCTRHGKNVDRRFASHSLTLGSPANFTYECNECSVVKAWPITKRATMSYDITYSTVGSLNTVLHFNTSCCGSQSLVCGGSDVCLVAAEALRTWSWVTCHWKGKLFRSARTWSQNPTIQFRNLSPLRPRYQNWIVDSGFLWVQATHITKPASKCQLIPSGVRVWTSSLQRLVSKFKSFADRTSNSSFSGTALDSLSRCSNSSFSCSYRNL